MRRILIVLLLPITISFQCRGQEKTSLTQLQADYFNALFSLNFPQAENILEKIEQSNNIEGIIGKTQLMWWKCISTGKPTKPLLRYISTTADNYKELPVELSMHFNSMRLRIHTSGKNYLRAWKEWKVFEDNLERCIQLCDEDTELFIRGIYHCMKAELQHRMPLLINDTISSPGNMAIGINLLETCSKSTNLVIRYESHYFLMRVYAELHEECLSSITHSSCLVDKFPENYIFRYYHLAYLRKADKNEEASISLKNGIEALENSFLSSEQKNYGRDLLLHSGR